LNLVQKWKTLPLMGFGNILGAPRVEVEKSTSVPVLAIHHADLPMAPFVLFHGW